MSFILSSSAFKNKETIPDEYTCAGENCSPPLLWKNVPSNAKSLVLIVDDPDAPNRTWVHWVVFNIPIEIEGFEANLQNNTNINKKLNFGKNDFKTQRYGGPCPPSGTHRYFFKLYALDCTLKNPSGSTKAEIENAMEGHILGIAELIGLFSKH